MEQQLNNISLLSHNAEHPEIYVGCKPFHQEEGTEGVWINALQPVKEILKQIAMMQYESSRGRAEMLLDGYCPDKNSYAIYGYTGFYDLKISANASIEYINQQALFIAKYGELGARLIAYYEGTIDAAAEVIEQRYQGAYKSELEYATQIFNNICLEVIPLALQTYIDYEDFRATIFSQHFFSIEVGGKTHIFFEWSGEPMSKECLEGFLMPFVNAELRPID